LVIGAGANRSMTGRMLKEFVEKTGIPFVTTQLGKGVIDELNPKFLGCAALSAGDFVHRAKGGADVIHVNFRSAEVDPVYFPQLEVVGDIGNAIWQIKEAIVPNPGWDFA